MRTSSSEWLIQLRNDMELITTEAAREHWPGPTTGSAPYYNYRLEHVRQDERDALRLLAKVGGNRDIVLASVWIHDRFQPQYVGPNHANRGAEWARQNLALLGFPQDKVREVCFAVANHSNHAGTIPRKAKEAQLLWDADKLSKIGALNIVAFLCANPAFSSNKITHDGIALIGSAGLAEARLMVEQFYFQASRIWGQERFNTQKAFYEALAREVAT